MNDLTRYLEHLTTQGGSDLHLKAGHRPIVRVQGELGEAPMPKLDAADVERLASGIVPDKLRPELERTGAADFAYSVDGIGRFRVNVFRQRGTVGIVMRRVVPAPPVLDSLHMPFLAS